jgi:hypothetical protein
MTYQQVLDETCRVVSGTRACCACWRRGRCVCVWGGGMGVGVCGSLLGSTHALFLVARASARWALQRCHGEPRPVGRL